MRRAKGTGVGGLGLGWGWGWWVGVGSVDAGEGRGVGVGTSGGRDGDGAKLVDGRGCGWDTLKIRTRLMRYIERRAMSRYVCRWKLPKRYIEARTFNIYRTLLYDIQH